MLAKSGCAVLMKQVAFFLVVLLATLITGGTNAQDLRDPYCDPAYRYVGANIFGVDAPRSFFGMIHGGDSFLDVMCHLQNIPGVTVELELPISGNAQSFIIPDSFDFGALKGLKFDATPPPVLKFYNFTMDGVPLDGEVKFHSASSAGDKNLLRLALMRLNQGRRLSIVNPGFGLLAESIDYIYLWSEKPKNDTEKKQFYQDSERAAYQLMRMMEERSVPIKHSLANNGTVWFEPKNGVESSIESSVNRGIEIFFKYEFEKDQSKLIQRYLSENEEAMTETEGEESEFGSEPSAQ